jgi:hypothetical protein
VNKHHSSSISFLSGILLIVLSGCSRTWAGTLMFLTPRDIIGYVGLALLFGGIAAILGRDTRVNFWWCFILSLVLTPLAGLIYCLVILTKK